MSASEIVAAVAGLGIGGLGVALLLIVLRGRSIRDAEKRAMDLLADAKVKHKEALLEAKEEAMKVIVKFASFTLSVELTDLLVRYITGVMDSFGYKMAEDSHIRGLVTLTFTPIRGV